jgi:hypothetical protein
MRSEGIGGCFGHDPVPSYTYYTTVLLVPRHPPWKFVGLCLKIVLIVLQGALQALLDID